MQPAPSTASLMFQPDDWVNPLPLERMFPLRQPLEVDVGCGKGRFLLARAAACPGINYLGIDRMLKRLRKVDRKAARSGLANVRLVRVEAAYAIRHLLPSASVSAFYIFFPDPWPKRRHQRRRMLTAVFVDSLHTALAPGGPVHIATDNSEYFEGIHEAFRADPRFSEEPAPVLAEAERTDFEMDFIAFGATISRCTFRKAPTT